MNNNINTQDNQPNQPAPEQPPEDKPEQIRRINPRWFFPADPDFFSDLLMEQNEQQ